MKEDVSIVLKDWRCFASRWASTFRRGMVVLVPLGLLSMVVGVPPVVLIFLWTYPFGRMSHEAMHVAREMVDKPFAFCMPGYRESLRRSSFLAAACLGLGFAPLGLVFLWMMSHHDGRPTTVEVLLHLANGFLVGAAALLCISVDLRFIVSRVTYGVILLLSIPLFFVLVILSPAFIQCPALGIPLALVVCVFMWVRLGDMSRVKRGHRMILEDALERRGQVGITKTASPWVDTLFRWLMADRCRLGLARYIWGSLYQSFGLALSHWLWILLSIVGSALVLGYAAQWFTTVAFVCLGLVALAVHLPVAHDAVRLPVGPRERCYATLAVAMATSLLLVGAAGVVTLCTWVFSLFLPNVAGLPYAGIDSANIFLPCLLAPWIFAWRLLGRRCPRIANATSRAAVISAIAAIALLDIAEMHWPGPIWMTLFAAVLTGGWLFLLLTLRDACMGASPTEPTSSKADPA